MPKGSQLLRAWRTNKGLTQTAAAAQVPASAAAWCEWETGAIPKLKVAFRIEEITEGEVPVSAWNEEVEAQAATGTEG
jgi:transcriptional regulator with XRE-family HTH domain